MVGRNHFSEIKKDCILKKKKKQFSAIKYSSLQWEKFFWINYSRGGNSFRLKFWNLENVGQNHHVLFK